MPTSPCHLLPLHEENPTNYPGTQGSIFNFKNEPAPLDLEKESTDPLVTILNSESRQIQSQLLVASEKGDFKAVFALLHQNIQSDKCIGMAGYTPLHHACNRGHIKIVTMLVKSGANVNLPNSEFETALHLAAYNGHVHIVEFLLDSGADINALNSDGETALFYACRRNFSRVIRVLLRRGVQRHHKNRYQDVAQDEATEPKAQQEFSPEALQIQDRFPLGQAQIISVFRFLDVRNLNNALKVCDRWHRAAEEPSLWKALGISSRWEMVLKSNMGCDFHSPMASFRPTSSGRRRPSSSAAGQTNRRRIQVSLRNPPPPSRPRTASSLSVNRDKLRNLQI